VLASDGFAADDGDVGDEEDDVPGDVHDEPIGDPRTLAVPLNSEVFDRLGMREDAHEGGSDGQLGQDDQVHLLDEVGPDLLVSE